MALLLAYLAAIAEPVPTAGGGVVLIAATTNAQQMQQLERAVTEAAAATHLQVATTRVASIVVADILDANVAEEAAPVEKAPTARLWIDAVHGSPVTLYLSDGARQRLYVRRISLGTGELDQIALESIAFIVRSSLEALIAGREIGISREEFAKEVAPRPALRPPVSTETAPPASPPAPLHRWLATVTGGYELVRTSPLPYQHRLVIRYQLRWTHLRVGVGGFASAPQTIGGVDAGARLLTGGLNVSTGLAWTVTRSLHLFVAGAIGVEGTRVEPVASSLGLRATSPFWSGALSVAGLGGIERDLVGRWSAGLIVGAEIHPSPERYVINDGQSTQVAVQTSHVRPLAGVFLGCRL